MPTIFRTHTQRGIIYRCGPFRSESFRELVTFLRDSGITLAEVVSRRFSASSHLLRI
jgi:hypothetical protein